MKYLRAKKDAYDYFSKYGVVEGELLTAKERNNRCPYLQDCVFDEVEINRNDTFVNFGCRFQINRDVVRR